MNVCGSIGLIQDLQLWQEIVAVHWFSQVDVRNICKKKKQVDKR